MQTTEIRETWTALYARLSLDDGNVGESMSIQSQKAILTRKAEELGIYNYQIGRASCRERVSAEV